MTRVSLPAFLAAALLAGTAAHAVPAASALPVIGGREAVAVVNGEPIPLVSLKRTMDEIADDVAKGEGTPQDPMTVLERFVTAKLIAQEARTSALDEDPKIKQGVEAFRREALRAAVLESPARKIKTADPKDVRRLLRLAKGEGRLSSLLFQARADADAFIAKVKAGADFGAEAEAAAAAGKGIDYVPDGWVPMGDLRPEVAGMAVNLEPGQVAAPIEVKDGHTCLKLLEWRVPDDAETLKQAEEEALTQQRILAVGKFTEEIKKRYAKIDYKTVEALDFDAPEPGFAKLKQDKRVLVTLKGADNVTIADLARALEGRFFHGVQRAAERKQIAKYKWPALDDVIVRRVALLEGSRLGLDKSADVLADVADYEESQLFALYVQKVIRPEAVTTDEEVREYFDRHRDEFMGPETLRLDQIAFVRRADGERALARLREGSNFEFTRKNAGGTIPAGDTRARLEVRGKELARADLPEAAREAIEGARKGELRIFEDPEEWVTYILKILEINPPARLEWGVAKELARRTLVQMKVRNTVDAVVARLRAAADVELFVNPETVRAALAGKAGPAR